MCLRLAAAGCAVLLSAASFSWRDTGHMVVGNIAWRKLKPAQRTHATALLKTLGVNTFEEGATWADDNKDKTTGAWHYINNFFRADGLPTDMKPPQQNILWAMWRQSTILRNSKAPQRERARALAYLMHFVGDIHQPLHAVARITPESPEGDKGGNDFKLLSPESAPYPVTNLHALWDAGCGLFPEIKRPLNATTRKAVSFAADKLLKTPPAIDKAKDPAAWARESARLAQQYVYDLQPNTKPSDAYLQLGQRICGRRAVAAGYRLSAMLNELLK